MNPPEASPVLRLRAAPRCRATSKRTKQPCQAPAMKGWSVCRFHGARGGAPKGERHGSYRHGLYCEEAKQYRREVSALLREAKAMMSTVG